MWWVMHTGKIAKRADNNEEMRGKKNETGSAFANAVRKMKCGKDFVNKYKHVQCRCGLVNNKIPS